MLHNNFICSVIDKNIKTLVKIKIGVTEEEVCLSSVLGCELVLTTADVAPQEHCVLAWRGDPSLASGCVCVF